MSLLIITGCIAPKKDVPFLAVAETQERLAEYEETLRWAIFESPFTEIVYADNSGFDLGTLQNYVSEAEKKEKNLELLGFSLSDPLVFQGKGYGEGKIMEYVLRNSRLVAENKEQYFYKLTGRLKIANIHEMMKGSRTDTVYFFRNYPLYEMLDTRFYGMPMEIYRRYFLNAYTMVNDEKLNYLEKIFYEICEKNRISYQCMKKYPEFRGRSGSTGAVYAGNPEQKFFDFLCRGNLFNHSRIYKMLLLLKSWNIIRF